MYDDSHSGDEESLFSATNLNLKEQNEQLQKEVALLKVQFDDALAMSTNIDKIQETNMRLTREVLDLKNEKEEIERRLEIILKTNSDLTESLEGQKKQLNQRFQHENEMVQNETNKVTTNFKAQMDSLYSQLNDTSRVNEDLKVHQKIFVSQIQRVLDAGEFFFQQKISNLDEFINLLQKSREVPLPKDEAPLQQISANDSTDYEKLIKNLKKKVRARTNACKSAAEDISVIQNAHRKEISAFQTQIEKLNKEKDEKVAELSSNISELKKKVEKLSNESAEAKCKNELLRDQIKTFRMNSKKQENPPSFPQIRTKSDEIDDDKEISRIKKDNSQENKYFSQSQLDHLNEKVTELTQMLSSSDMKRNEAQETARKAESELQKCQITITKLENDLNSLRIVHNESVSEIESLRKTLHDRPQTNQNSVLLQRQATFDQDNKIIMKKEEKISQLHSEIKQKELQIDEQSSKMEKMKIQIGNLEEELKKVRGNFNDYVFKTEAKHIPTIDEILPPSAFKFSEFDANLSNEISKIATNIALQPSSKIEFSFRAIQKHYQKKINELQKEVEISLNHEYTMSNSINQFLVDASIATTGSPITANDFFNGNGGEYIINSIVNVANTMTAATRERDQLQSIISQIASIIGSDTDIISKIDELKKECNSTHIALEKLVKKFNSVKSNSKSKTKKCRANESNLRNEIEALYNKNINLEATIQQQSEKIDKLSKDNKRLQFDLNAAKKEADNEESGLRTSGSISQSDEIDSIKENFNHVTENYKNEISQLKKKCEFLVQQQNTYENDISRLKQQNISNQSIIDRLKDENSDLLKQKQDFEMKTTSLYETEKSNLKKSFDQTIDQLREQCDKNRQDIQKLVKTISSRDEKIKELNTNSRISQNEKVKLTNEITQLKEQIEREKLLTDASLKSQILTLEAKYKEQIDQIKSSSESEQRNMLLYAVNAFRSIFSAGRVEEKSYKMLIDKVKDQMNKLSASDQAIRRMLNVFNSQTTQDAVAQLLFLNNNQN